MVSCPTSFEQPWFSSHGLSGSPTYSGKESKQSLYHSSGPRLKDNREGNDRRAKGWKTEDQLQHESHCGWLKKVLQKMSINNTSCVNGLRIAAFHHVLFVKTVTETGKQDRSGTEEVAKRMWEECCLETSGSTLITWRLCLHMWASLWYVWLKKGRLHSITSCHQVLS